MDIESIAVVASAVPIITATVEVIKRALPDVPSRYWPSVSLGVGVLLVCAIGAATGQLTAMTPLVGLVTGLAASGLYDAGKAFMGLNSGADGI